MTHPEGGRLRNAGAAHGVIGGRYRLLEAIGVAGVVWHARDELFGRDVSVREVGTPAGAGSSDSLDRQLATMLGALAAGGLDHPGVVRVLDVVWQPGRLWIVTAYLPGPSLREAIEARGPLDRPTAANVGLALLSALRAAHAAGVTHGDVRPGTVLLAADGRFMLTDFGPGALAGSPDADLSALGATLASAVAGGRDAGRLDAVVAGLTAADPERRMSAGDAESMLREIADEPPAAPPGQPTPIAAPPGQPTPIAAPPGQPRPIGEPAEPPRPIAAPPVPVSRPAPSRPVAGHPGRRARLTVSAVVVLALAGVAGAALVGHRRPPARETIRATVRTAPPSPSASVSAGCRLGAAVAGSTVAASAVRQGYALPEGWLWYTDRAGLAVAMPDGWLRTIDGAVTCFRDPDGYRLLSVDTAAPLSAMPLAQWQRAEQAGLADGSLPGYRAVGMSLLPTRQGGADWEYTWLLPDGQRLHERRVWLAMGNGRAYVVTWATRDQDWTINQPFEQLILASLS